MVADLLTRHPGLRPRLVDRSGGLPRYLAVFVNGARAPDLSAPVREGDTVLLVPAVAGG